VSSHHGEKPKSLGKRIKQELLDDPRPTVGRDVLIIGFVLGLIWLFLLYLQPGDPWSNGRFLVGAICFVLWGVADLLPRRLRSVAATLRGAVLVFLLGLGTWIVADLLGWILGF
jgi:hypothetical protein